ncbi:MAG TPA: chemotaxis protein CheA [Longimicrobiales bacterium]|nr:chemotaxis protein CheA [Longimicrobiales bacterium]
MDTSRYIELFLAESREHLQSLARSLLGIEAGEGEEPVEEAFRAAHTLKGMAAAMGYGTIAAEAHALEDRLDAIRSGALRVDAHLIDELLAASDRLHAALEASATDGPASPPDAAAASEPPLASAAGGADRDDGGVPRTGDDLEGLLDEDDLASLDAVSPAARILIHPSAPLKAARAAIICRAIEKVSAIESCEPAEFDDAFDGNFRLVFPAGADVESLDATIRGCGEVQAITWETASRVRLATRGSRPDAARPSAAVRRVRVDQAHLDSIAEAVGELGILRSALAGLAEPDTPEARVSEDMGRLLNELEHAILGVRMIPVREVFERFPRVVRDAARASGKDVALALEGADITLDRAILEEIGDPLLHLLRNAVDHGIEPPEERRAAGKPAQGRLVLTARRERAAVVVEVEDDGRGISRAEVLAQAQRAGLIDADVGRLADDELLRVLARPGFSTAEAVSELSGRGVGMDVAVSKVRAIGGSVGLTTRAGAGTTVRLRLPLSLALAPALRVQVGGEDYVIPLNHVEEVVELNGKVARQRGREVLRLRGEVVPLVRLADALSCRGERGRETAAVVAGGAGSRAAIAVERLIGREQMVVKRFVGPAGTLPCFAGVTLLGDGRPALVLDPMSIL